jgi:sigma-B regulation protein RsbU (phosphoserine phosphatase)
LLLRAGDRLFFYTDGVTEAENEAAEEFGYERLVRAAAPPATETAAATNRRIMNEGASFCKGNFGDDVTLVVLALR